MSRPAFRVESADPWAGDAWHPDLPSSFDNHAQYRSKPLSPEDYAQEDERFLSLYFETLKGADHSEALEASARRLGVWGPIGGDRRSARRAPAPVEDGFLCDVLENEVPDLVPVALDSVLGPWADFAPSPRLARAAVAAVSHSTLAAPGQKAIGRWHRSQTSAPGDLRRAVRCLERIPAMLWSVDGAVRPLLPLAPGYLPDGPVDLSHAVPLAPGPVRAVVARLLPLEDGRWVGVGAIGLPTAPPVAPLERRLSLELLRHRRHERRANWDDLLREHPEVLYRWCCTWTWHFLEAP